LFAFEYFEYGASERAEVAATVPLTVGYSMSSQQGAIINDILQRHEADILSDWMAAQVHAAEHRADQISTDELRQQSAKFLSVFRQEAAKGALYEESPSAWQESRRTLEAIARTRTHQGFSPVEIAVFVFSLKQPLFDRLQADARGAASAADTWRLNRALDTLGLHMLDVHQKGREEIIQRQQQELLELSTPVVSLWDGVLALPLIGTLDSARTQVVMESLLDRIVETGAAIAIIDITGVPTVDTLVAQHLLKTVAAARLMGADCIISGIRPQIAQTIVHLGVELGSVTTKASLADAFALALQRLDLAVRPVSDSR